MRSAPKTIIVAGYGPWAKAATNPAAQVVRGVGARSWSELSLVALELPVRTDGLAGLVEDALAEHKPDAWIGVGLAPGAPTLRVESTATNWRDFEVPDNDGQSLSGTPIFVDGPAAYAATTPNAAIAEAMRAAGIPAVVSYAAGTHLCNQMLYTIAHLGAARRPEMRCGFIHVPYTTEGMVAETSAHRVEACLPLAMMVEGVSVAVRTLAGTLDGEG